MAVYRVMVGEVTATATSTQLSQPIGGQNTIKVPAASTRIKSVTQTGGTDAAANGAAVFGCRISGSGVTGTHDLVGGSVTVDGTPTAAAAEAAHTQETEIEVAPNEEVEVFGWMEGDDVGDVRLGVGLEFE